MPNALKQNRCSNDQPETRGRTAEFELLLACCVSPRADCRDKLERLLTRQYDFAAFLKLAAEHRIIPQVYQALSAHFELLTDADLAMLRAVYEESARRALRLTGELVRILRHFESHGIEGLPYKGPVLAQVLYGDVTARQFFDLDILVLPQDVGSAKKAFGELGYIPEIKLSIREEQIFLASGYEYAFDGAAGSHALELKWRILPRFYSVEFETKTLLRHAGRIHLGGYSFRTLHPEDLLLVLCVHAAKHMWAQLSWLCDIAELAGSREIQWETIYGKAEQLGIRRIVSVSLLLAHELLGSDLPFSLQEWCHKNSGVDFLSEQISWMISEGYSYDTESVAYFNFMLRLRERWRDRARFLARLAWTPGIGEWSIMRVPERLSFMYRFVRFGRLAKRIFRSDRLRSGIPIEKAAS